MAIEKLLQEIGLTKQETRCYLALHNLKEAKTGELSKKARIATSNLYPILDSLIKKGLVSYKIINNIRIFMPSPAESFNELIEKKQKELNESKEQVQKAILELQTGEEVSDKFSDYKFFIGIAGIKSMWLEILDYMKNQKQTRILKIYSSNKTSSENLIGFYNEFHKERKRLGHEYKIIMSHELEKHGNKRRKEGAKVKFTTINNEATFGVFEELYFITHNIGEIPQAFLIKNKKIANSFEEIFEKIWRSVQ